MPEAQPGQLRAQRQWIKENRLPLVFMALLVASMAFRAGLYPPSGFYRSGPNAGKPVLLVRFPDSHARFMLLNSMALVISLLLVVMVSSDRFYRTPASMTVLVVYAIIDLACLLSIFVCSQLSISQLSVLLG